GFRQWRGAPVLDARSFTRREIVAQVMRGGQPCDIGESRARRRNRSMSKIRVEATRRESTSARRQPRKHRTHRRCECESVFSMDIDDRFEPETIADDENHAPTKVTDRDGEHAAEPLQEGHSPMFVCVQNELGIGTSTEMK